MATRSEIDKGHVFYFEPNDLDIGKDQQGQDVPLFPHLEDLCVAMTLTADVFPRDKKCIYTLDEQNKSQMVRRSLSWISYVNNNNGETISTSQQIINSGVQMGNENYLTTFYTEIGPDKYIESEMVEGLGVTSVNISFESWYTPTITINFVDVHGSALWGREEAIHDNGDITSDNLLGIFFTQPYPLFRLQVKGFLGHDVTYQLSVSNFKGRYNSQTGNFEATATFIGYSYSLLTDIPLKLLSVVSEMSYVGKEYWDAHVNDPSWQLLNADGTKTQPIKLYQLIEDIRVAVGSLDSQKSKNCENIEIGTSNVNGNSQIKDPVSEDRLVSLESAYAVNDAMYAENDIGAINSALEDFVKQCRSFTETERGGTMIIGRMSRNGADTEEQILMIVNAGEDGKVKPKDALREKYQTLCKVINQYNEKHPDDKFVNAIESFTDFHKIASTCGKDKLRLNPIKIFKTYDVLGSNRYNQVDKPNYHQFRQNAAVEKNIKIKDIKIYNMPLYEDTSKQLEALYNNFNNPQAPLINVTLGNGFGEYAFLLPLGKMRAQIGNIFNKLSSIGNNLETKIENQVAQQSNSSEKVTLKQNDDDKDSVMEETRKKKIIDILGFEPTIGNFVKIMMCHLETFVEVMMHCGDKIYSQLNDRTPSNFGIDLKDTDISDNNKVGDGTDNKTEKPIWPWPALYNPNSKENSETKSSSNAHYEALGWPNDYPPSGNVGWEEEKVVLSCLDAIQRYEETLNGRVKGVTNKYSALPMSAMDLAVLSSPFENVGKMCRDIEHLSPQLGLRIAHVIGLSDNECGSDIAESIGYMDALNLISSCSDYKRLKNAVTSKEGNQDFVTQVIDYLTCKNNIKQTSESENGNTYNVFETILPGGGNPYCDTRHPMYMESDGKYKYTYTYAKPLSGSKYVSIIPSELQYFSGINNPYADLLKPTTENGVTTFAPNFSNKLNTGSTTGVSQWLGYTCKSDMVVPESLYTDYTNEQLFYVVENKMAVNNLLRQIEALRNGEIKFKDYSVKGEKEDSDLKKFIDRRYKLSLKQYFSYFESDKNYRVLMPSFNKIDENYVKEHLCLSPEQKTTVKYDTQWSTDTNSDIYKKISLKVKEAGTSFKNGDSDFDINEVFIGELPIMINSNIKGSLFSSEFYYQQNDISDDKLRDKAKSYLILSSLMAGVEEIEKDLFKSDVTSVVKYLPPFYVLFLGALLWRKSQETEPLKLGAYKNSSPDQDTSFISKNDKIFYIDTNDKKNWYSIEDYYMKYEDIDMAVKNKLIKMFEEFANSREYRQIIEYCELKKNDGSTINSNGWKELRQMWSDNNFDASNPSQWTQLFSNFFGKYSSITLPSSTKSILRLLIDEENKAMGILKNLYGLNGGYIVGRSTTKRVGLGDAEVTVTKEQMKGYLRGFERRIRDIEDKSTETVKNEVSISASEVGRDHAISLYYSLKHLWDTWLITSARDQFTIDNFFNKYFIFIDSFYINTYNMIKLNAEYILDAYNAKDPNLFTFIENITSREGCMLFALPTFLDSNVLENGASTVGAYKKYSMEWKKDNLRKLFTPIPFNEMGTPQVNNVFVFVYTHPFSDNALENTDKRFDSYMMNNESDWPSVLTKEMVTTSANADRQFDETNYNIDARPNNSISDDEDDLVSSRYGYMMPCFGVTVNRGNNYIFKGINVNMDSPKITAVAAQTWENILLKTGADGTKRIFFHGQDIYSIYSQYSYGCEIEMLGCAQIQPLMYFQLLNIPMWRGTYMIYKVTHTMAPGTMTTKFVGMKMSRRQAPYATGYFTVGKRSAQTRLTTNYGDSNRNGSYGNGGGSYQAGYAVGGTKMIQAIFGEFTNWRLPNTDYGKFGYKRSSTHTHAGVDISGAPEGTKLYAPWDGVVTFVKTGWTKLSDDAGGNYIVFQDTSKMYQVIYFHCKQILVKVGDKVKAGEPLALLGHTGGDVAKGIKCGNHLHLELYINGRLNRRGEIPTRQAVDPTQEFGYIVNDDMNPNT